MAGGLPRHLNVPLAEARVSHDIVPAKAGTRMPFGDAKWTLEAVPASLREGAAG